MKKSNTIVTFVLLHLMLMVYSMSGICSKMAARQPFLSPKFIFYYGLVILLLGFYALAWQQIIKQLPLTTAYANRAVTVIWGAIWGLLIFHEKITINKIIGIVLVVSGVVLFALSDDDSDEKDDSKNPMQMKGDAQ